MERTKQRRQQGRDKAAKSDGRSRTIQILVKVDGSKAFPLEDVYVTCEGRAIGRGEELKGCGISDGGTLQGHDQEAWQRKAKGQEEQTREEARQARTDTRTGS